MTHSVWNRHISDPKTRASKAPIPEIAPLLRFLERHRATKGNPQTGWIFAGANGNPLHLDNLVRREIRPLLEKAKVEGMAGMHFAAVSLRIFRGWACRSKLHSCSCVRRTSGRLRITTLKSSTKTPRQAMQRLEALCNERAMRAFEASSVTVVN